MLRPSLTARATHLSLLFAAAVWMVACGGDDNGSGSGGDDTGEVDTGEVDAGADVEADAAADAVEDTEPPPECAAGERRCVAGVEAYEICSDEGDWERTDCPVEQICFEGECANPDVCEPLAVTACNGCNEYVGCNAAGTAEGTFPVPFTQTCIEEDGVPQLIERVCLPSEARCIDDRRLEACDECGLGYEFATDCMGDDETTICDVDRCVPLCEFIKKRQTYIGCEYWAVDLDNAFVPSGGGQFLDADGQPFAVVLSNPNPELTANVEVFMRDGLVAEATIEPGEVETVELHYYSGASDREGTPLSDLQGTMIGYEGFRITADVPIIAYQFNPLDNETVYSNDASLLFPTSSLGTEYLVMTRRQTFDLLKGYVTIMAVLEGTTEVTITLPEFTPENPVETLSGFDVVRSEPIPRLRGGETFTVELEQYMVFNLETDRIGADLTGARVTSNRPIAVFGGSEAANAPNDDSCVYRASFDDWVCEATRVSSDPVPCEDAEGNPSIELCSDYITCCADHLEHQMLPLFAWGQTYNATRSAPRGDEADVWRVMAGDDDIEVSLVGLPDTWPLPNLLPRIRERQFTLDKGEWFDFQSPVDFEILADGPIMVGQFLAAEFAPYPQSIDAAQPPHSDADTGDPAFILAVPVEQYRTDYSFLCPDAFEFDYVTITAPVDAVVNLDGELVPDEEWETFGRGDYHVARILIEDGAHTVTSDLPVGIVVHGYDSFVSYGYPGGLDIREIFGRD